MARDEDGLVALMTREASRELDEAMRVIRHCVGQLDDDQVWWRPEPSMNSVANLMLHLAGNVRQWITCGVGDRRDDRNRPQEFAERGPISRQTLVERLEAVISSAQETMSATTADDLETSLRIQAFEVTGLGAILHSVSHFRGHTQEIVHMTRSLLGDAYQFDFVPSAEQGGPST